MDDVLVEDGGWYEFETIFEEKTGLRVVRGQVMGIENTENGKTVRMVRRHDAIPLFSLRFAYVVSYRKMSEAEVLAECL